MPTRCHQVTATAHPPVAGAGPTRARIGPRLLACAILCAAFLLAFGTASAGAQTCGTTDPVTFGASPTAGTIGAVGEVDCFSFSVSGSDTVRLRVVETGGVSLNPTADIVGPGGGVVCGASTANDQNCVLTNGAHVIRVRASNGTSLGSFAVAVQSLTAPVGCTTLAFDRVAVSGSVPSAGDTACYRFVAGPGTSDVVRLRVVESSGSWTTLTDVVRPDGSAQAFPCTATVGEEFTCALSVAGTFTILVRDNGGPATGDFRLGLQRLNDPGGCPAALAYGDDPTLGTIDTTLQTDCYRFTGTAGDRVRVRTVGVTGSLDPRTEVLSPAGGSVAECTSPTTANDLTCLLPTSGTYTILVRDNVNNALGTYRISVQSLTAPVGCTTLPFDRLAVTGSVALAGDAACYRFVAGPGTADVVRLRVLESTGGWTTLTDVVRPDGSAQAFPCTATVGEEFSCSLSVAGTFTILVRDNAGASTGDFRLSLQRLNDPGGCPPALAYGDDPTVGTIDTTLQTDCYRFTGTAGDRVRVRTVGVTGSLDPRTEVVSPAGGDVTECTSATTANDLTCLLPTSGTYTILVRDNVNNAVGTYRVSRAEPDGAGGLHDAVLRSARGHGLGRAGRRCGLLSVRRGAGNGRRRAVAGARVRRVVDDVDGRHPARWLGAGVPVHGDGG